MALGADQQRAPWGVPQQEKVSLMMLRKGPGGAVALEPGWLSSGPPTWPAPSPVAGQRRLGLGLPYLPLLSCDSQVG